MKLIDLIKNRQVKKTPVGGKYLVPASSRQINVLGADPRIETWTYPIPQSAHLVGVQLYKDKVRIMSFERLVGKDSRIFDCDTNLKDLPEINHLIDDFLKVEKVLEVER